MAAVPLIVNIIPKTPKPGLIGRIVPRVSIEGQGVTESPAKDKEIPTVVIELHGKQVALTAKAKHAGEQASGGRSSTRSANFRKEAKSEDSDSRQNQTAATSDGGNKQPTKVKERGEVTEDSDKDLSQPQRSGRGTRGFRFGHTRRTSQAVALSFTSFHKRQRKRRAKGMGASPEAGAEAGAQSGVEAAMPLECKATNASEKRTHKRRRTLLGQRRKQSKSAPELRPKLCRSRTKRVYYTYVSEPIPATPTLDGNEQQQRMQSITPSEVELSSLPKEVQKNSSTPIMSARSSRVIKTPKRFLDEEMISLPRGLKNQQREDGKPSPSCHESNYDGNLQSDSESISVADGSSAVTKFSSKPRPGTSHLEIYKNLKKLTLKLAEKKKGHSTEGDPAHHDDGLTHVRKRRRSKITVEEIDSPGVVRKLAVSVDAEAKVLSHLPSGDTGNNSKNCFFLSFIIYKDLVFTDALKCSSLIKLILDMERCF